MFLSQVGDRESDVIQCVQRCVSPEMNEALLAPFTSDEVWAALESIGDLKAPGADGMPSIFYKQFWQLLGERVKEEVLEVLNGGDMPQGWNDTIIVLIPKVKQPEKLKDLRPISLCNVIHNIISNMLHVILGMILLEVI